MGEVTNAELGHKLDLVLQKIDGLEQRVNKLENRDLQVKEELKKVSTMARTAKLDSALSVPQNEEEKKSFFSKLRLQLKSDEVKAKGAWTKKETWDQVNKNLSEFKIRKLLGNPNTIKSSLNPRIERVYHYQGDLNADGEEEIGQVNFFREKVVSFKSPF
jgi:small-conductance mechanosensitive channel